jgi:hypothetical protein
MVPGAQELRLRADELLELGKRGPADARGGLANSPLMVLQPVRRVS